MAIEFVAEFSITYTHAVTESNIAWNPSDFFLVSLNVSNEIHCDCLVYVENFSELEWF